MIVGFALFLLLVASFGWGAYLGFRLGRGQRPVVPPSKPPEAVGGVPRARNIAPDTILSRAAVHEAGHAVVAARCTLVGAIHHVHITLVGTGIVKHNMRVGTNHDWCELVILLAGLAAEGMAFGKLRSGGGREDLEKSVQVARALAERGGPFPWAAARVRSVAFDRMFTEPPSDETVAILRYAYDLARDILDRHHQTHARLTGALLGTMTIEEADLQKLLPAMGGLRISRLDFSGRFV